MPGLNGGEEHPISQEDETGHYPFKTRSWNDRPNIKTDSVIYLKQAAMLVYYASLACVLSITAFTTSSSYLSLQHHGFIEYPEIQNDLSSRYPTRPQ